VDLWRGADVQLLDPSGTVLYDMTAPQEQAPFPLSGLPAVGHVTLRQGLCDHWSPPSHPPTALQENIAILTVGIAQPYDCEREVWITHLTPGTDVSLYLEPDRPLLASGFAAGNTLVLNVAPELLAGEDLLVIASACQIATSVPAHVDTITELALPRIDPPVAGKAVVNMHNLSAGAKLEVGLTRNGQRDVVSLGRVGAADMPVTISSPLRERDVIDATQHACERSSETAHASVSSGPSPPPTTDLIVELNSRIDLSAMFYATNITAAKWVVTDPAGVAHPVSETVPNPWQTPSGKLTLSSATAGTYQLTASIKIETADPITGSLGSTTVSDFGGNSNIPFQVPPLGTRTLVTSVTWIPSDFSSRFSLELAYH
jgi:hypothetical protein